jgi:hypothetical protein
MVGGGPARPQTLAERLLLNDYCAAVAGRVCRERARFVI